MRATHLKMLSSLDTSARYTYTADDTQDNDISRRIAIATKRCGQLHHVFSSPDIPMSTKIMIYRTVVISILTYGCEAWRLDEKTQARS